ncbi:bifunctional tetrahydrofolate synthase/dihydrofolate synthase [Marinobacterium jannaschii]|uniref:bifunctional tetrahydrofolate synthase/dihydrofolate synthase n=1 Tax=Marinobacterium jannaschii TaxID=64970 RepID=UPI000685155B|nr:bifunctional tetrahydrofolate synthase/dihydrofolate synthase [Marinobacterium jannaschii]
MNTESEQLSLEQWLSWIEACHPAEIELGLGRVSEVAGRMKLDLGQSQVITIAGTNGKGSTVAYLESILRGAGYSVGCYTSPHFIKYNERIRINGSNASDQSICYAFAAINQAREEIELTYFEYGTLAALQIFTQAQPDVVLLEVGLGGRLDAVNIVDADISVVTTVSIDHVDWLGDDRNQIGREKAGVFRADRPAVCGEPEPPLSIAEVAAETGARLVQVGVDFSYRLGDAGWSWSGFDAGGQEVQLNGLALPQLPLANAATAAQVVKLLPLVVSDQQISDGISAARLTGRMQHVQLPEGDCWLDVAHNPEAAELLAKRLADSSAPVRLVLGMLADKDIGAVVELIRPVVSSWYLAGLDVPRGQSADNLAQHMIESDHHRKFSSVAAALGQARADLQAGERLIVAGSFFTVSDALEVLSGEAGDGAES